ncbi:MAG: methyltransferase domain-containing protein [Pseudomonadota bacterium]
MEGGAFTGWIAETYDALHDPRETDLAVECLAELAGGGPALEFAIGTGRLALPLAERGVAISGIELSPDMIAKLREKPGGAGILVVQGDMATAEVPGSFSLVLLAFNTIMNLTTQAEQVACFENAARHLAPGGRFVIEVLVPPLRRLPPGETHRIFAGSDDHWGADEFDPATQSLTSHHIWVVDGQARTFSLPLRYVWPSELDLMARIAGLVPLARWEDWLRAPFTADSPRHVSVWEKPIDA